MYCTQNEKINQVTEKTLVVGIDIGSKTHYARAFNWRGQELTKYIRFDNTAEGFKEFDRWVLKVKKQNNLSKLLSGAEPTAHYWYAIADHLASKGTPLVLVNPTHVKFSKALDDNNPSKSDQKDPKVIAKLVIEGRYSYPYIPEKEHAELRIANNNYLRLKRDISRLKNQVQRWLKIYFPEYKEVFVDPFGEASIEVLRRLALPSRIIKMDAESINEIFRNVNIRAVGIKRSQRLIEAAKGSIGRKTEPIAASMEIEMLMEEYRMKTKQIEAVEQLLASLCESISFADKMEEIKGIGPISVAGFLAEVGDIRRFQSPKQIQKYAGLGLKESSSGDHEGKTEINRRGRKRLRTTLFQAVLSLVSNNEAFKALHHYNIKEKPNPMKKKQSIVAISCKLIRIFYAMLTKGVSFDPEKMLKDIKRPPSLVAA